MDKIKHCNYCGISLDEFDLRENFTIHKTVGYGSVHDGEDIDLQLCCRCFDEFVDKCKISPSTMEVL